MALNLSDRATAILSGISLDLAGLLFLLDLDVLARWTALNGNASLLDAFLTCPGMLKQQSAAELSKGEYPACAAMTTGYVFRVENEATVLYLQRVGRTGQLTTLIVSQTQHTSPRTSAAQLPYLACVALSLTVLLVLFAIADFWASSVLVVLLLIRLLDVWVVRRRASIDWHGASEPGVQGDLLVLLSQDRWMRLRGPVDSLKALTSGQWLRDPTAVEGFLILGSKISTCLAAIVTANASQQGKTLIIALLCCSAGLLSLANESVTDFHLHGSTIRLGSRKQYLRRLHLAEELIKETSRSDWAVRMGMVPGETKEDGPFTM